MGILREAPGEGIQKGIGILSIMPGQGIQEGISILSIIPGQGIQKGIGKLPETLILYFYFLKCGVG